VQAQRSLFGRGAPVFDPELRGRVRRELAEGAWVEHLPGWLQGHQALFDQLVTGVAWRQERREMYERTVEVPRLIASLPADGDLPAVVDGMRAAVERAYGDRFPHVSLGYYRDGRDSVAWHGDYVARNMPEAIVATVSLGEPRRFLLRPTGGGSSVAYNLGWGDLIVMGGTCQRTWQHCIPKSSAASGPRIALMFRPDWAKRAGYGWRAKKDPAS
jgi:alkylated DNA repair dioxygenase AlkB